MKTTTVLATGIMAALLALTACGTADSEPADTATPATSAAAAESKYPGVDAGTIEVGYLDALAANGITIMDDPAQHAAHGRATCQHIEAGDNTAALDYLRDQTNYSQIDRMKVFQVAEYSLCTMTP